MKFRIGILALLCAFFYPACSWADGRFIPPEPRDLQAVEFYLVTRGAGAEVYTKYGHTMIRVVDPSHHLDVNYNWGAFSFEDPNFIWKFLRGFLRYFLDISPSSHDLRVSQFERRWLVQERLNLTAKQKAALLARLNREAQPDRRHYRYLFFTDNCATRPRNFLNDALGGKIAERSQKEPTGRTFRDKVMDFNASSPVMAMGQDVLLNNEADQKLSKWEEMFVPLVLRDYLLTLPAYNDDGTVREGEKLLSDTQLLVEFPDPAVPFFNGYALIWMLIGTPLLLGLVLAGKTSFRKLGLRLFGLALALWGAIAGLFASFLTLSWAFSEHTVLPHNANLWLLWPTDWFYLFLGIFILLQGAAPRSKGLLARLTGWLTCGHLAALGLYVLLAGGGIFTQYVLRVLVYFGSLALLLYGATLYFSGLPWRKG